MTPNKALLIVDDEKDIVNAYVDFLSPKKSAQRTSSRTQASAPSEEQSNDYEIYTAYSGEEAIQLIKKLQVAGKELAGGFFDVKMPGAYDGLQTIQEIWKTQKNKMHCTIVTAYHDRSIQDMDLLFGPDVKDKWDYLNKPFTSAEIIQKARQMIASWNKTRTLEDTLTALKNAQEKLILAERLSAIGQVARGIGHEFGNILQRIIGKADISLHLSDGAEIKKNLEIIIHACERAGIVVRNLQGFSKEVSFKETTDLSKVAEDCLSLINHEFHKASITISKKFPAPPMVKGNPVELQQVFLNLFINALHAMPKGGELSISSESLGNDKIMICVTDTGTGIAPEILSKVFDYAFTTKGELGSGLGLSISKKIVEDHGGSIEVQSTPGKGAAFLMSFPSLKE